MAFTQQGVLASDATTRHEVLVPKPSVSYSSTTSEKRMAIVAHKIVPT
jgi:hypothetical protein